MSSREWRGLPAAVREAIELHQGDNPVRLSDIADALGVKMRSATLKPGISGEIRIDDGDGIIRINRHDPKTRQRFTAAHEIAHYLLHRDQIGDGIEDDKLYRSSLSDQREQEANRLAADLLMPRPLVMKVLAEAEEKGVGDKQLYMAEELGVSEAALNIRLEVLGISADALATV